MDLLFAGPIPPLRGDLEIQAVEHEGRPMLHLSDILGLREESCLVSPPVVMIAALFDGKRRVPDVRAALAAENVILSDAEIQNIVEQLDKLGLLETAQTAAARTRALDEFRKSGVRHTMVPQRGLAENPLELGAFLGKFYTDPQGPGDGPAARPDGPAPLGLVSPHIDFFRGGPHYAWAYNELSKHRPPDLIVGLGVAHMSPNSPWIMTKKSYETPFGPMEVDASLYDEVRAQLWYDPLDDEWAHAKEHSLEFQAIWLRHLWRNDTPKWLPILCSSYERFCNDRAPSSIETIEKALVAIGSLLRKRAEAGQRILILAGIDLAHVGKRFGDEFDITPEWEQKIEKADRAALDQAVKLDADAFFLGGVGEHAWRKVCGLSALYTSLRWIRALSPDGVSGKVLSYGQAPDPAGGIVSFTSAVFEEKK